MKNLRSSRTRSWLAGFLTVASLAIALSLVPAAPADAGWGGCLCWYDCTYAGNCYGNGAKINVFPGNEHHPPVFITCTCGGGWFSCCSWK